MYTATVIWLEQEQVAAEFAWGQLREVLQAPLPWLCHLLLYQYFVYRCVCITGPFFMCLNSPLPNIAKQATRGRTRQITTKYFNRADGQDFVLWPPQIGTTLWQRILEAPGKLTPTSGGVYDNCAVAVSSVSLMCRGGGWIIPQSI